MGHKESPETVQLQNKNLANFRKWMASTGKSMILPISGKGVVYAGFPGTEFSKYRKEARKNGDLTAMWQAIEKINKNSKEITGITAYDTINTVLKRLKGPLPVLYETFGANMGNKKKYANMLDVANALCDKNWRLLPKGDHKRLVWDALSKIYVDNAKGDLAIFEGSQNPLKQLDRRFTLINTELAAILKNKNLSKDTIRTAEYIAKRYSQHHSEQYKNFKGLLKSAKKGLT